MSDNSVPYGPVVIAEDFGLALGKSLGSKPATRSPDRDVLDFPHFQ